MILLPVFITIRKRGNISPVLTHHHKLISGQSPGFFAMQERILTTLTYSLAPKMQNIQTFHQTERSEAFSSPQMRKRQHSMTRDWQDSVSTTHLNNAKCCQDFRGLQSSALLVLSISYLLMAAFQLGSSLCLVSFSWSLWEAQLTCVLLWEKLWAPVWLQLLSWLPVPPQCRTHPFVRFCKEVTHGAVRHSGSPPLSGYPPSLAYRPGESRDSYTYNHTRSVQQGWTCSSSHPGLHSYFVASMLHVFQMQTSDKDFVWSMMKQRKYWYLKNRIKACVLGEMKSWLNSRLPTNMDIYKPWEMIRAVNIL